MIAAISMMRRRPDVTLATFRRHWLDPHGVMTAELPGVRHYVQSHCIDTPDTNAHARALAIDGFPELWFDDYAARHIAYTSPRIAECNVDSEHFVGAVRRLVTTPQVTLGTARIPKGSAKVILVATGADDPGWSGRTEARVRGLPGLVGYVAHAILEQAGPPASKIAALDLHVAGFAEATFATPAALGAVGSRLIGAGPDAGTTAVYAVEDYLLV